MSRIFRCDGNLEALNKLDVAAPFDRLRGRAFAKPAPELVEGA